MVLAMGRAHEPELQGVAETEPARRFLNGGTECKKPGSGQLRVVWVETGRGHSVEEGGLEEMQDADHSLG